MINVHHFYIKWKDNISCKKYGITFEKKKKHLFIFLHLKCVKNVAFEIQTF